MEWVSAQEVLGGSLWKTQGGVSALQQGKKVSLKGSRGFGSHGCKRPVRGKGESPCEECGEAKVQFIPFSVIEHNFRVPSKKSLLPNPVSKIFSLMFTVEYL